MLQSNNLLDTLRVEISSDSLKTILEKFQYESVSEIERCSLLGYIVVYSKRLRSSPSVLISLLLFWGTDLTSWRHAVSGITVLHVLFGVVDKVEKIFKEVEKEVEKIFEDVLVQVIQVGADCCVRDNRGRSPTDVACEYRYLELWERALVRCGVDVEAVFEDSGECATVFAQSSSIDFTGCTLTQANEKVCSGEAIHTQRRGYVHKVDED
jgi:hypothetical protein